MRRTIVVGVAVVVLGATAWFAWKTSGRVLPTDERGSALASGTADAPSALIPDSPSPTLAARPKRPEAPTTSPQGKPDDRAEADPVRAPIAALLGELSSQDADVRRAAADRIVTAGYFAIERVARQAGSLGSDSWQTFADAVSRKTWYPSPVGALMAAAHTAPDAHRRRLIDLARQIDPEAGRTPTPQEIEAIVRREVVEKGGTQDDWPGEAFVIFGHAGAPAVLRLLEEGGPNTEVLDRASSVLSAIAQPEDIPALRKLLSEGNSNVADALGRLDALGYTEALDVLLEAVRAGRFDDHIASALWHASNRDQAARTVCEWVEGRGPSLTDEDRSEAAGLFIRLESRAAVPTLEAWSASTRDPALFVGLAKALTKLGSAKGIEMLVRVVEEEKVEPSPHPAPQDAGRLSAEGFDEWQRLSALQSLDAVALQLSSSGDGSPDARPKEGPWSGATYGDLHRIAAEVRAWWEALRDRLHFDEKAREWRRKSN